MNESILNRNLQIKKGEFFPESIFGNPKTNAERKEIMKKVKEELENPKKVKHSFHEKNKIIGEIYSIIQTPTRRTFEEEELIEKIEKLMDNNIYINHVNSEGESFLMFAIKNKKTEIARYFIENKIDINITENILGRNALNYLVEFENCPSLTKLLVENKIEIKNDPIKYIIGWNYINPDAIKMIKILIENNVIDINAEIKDGKNLLMLCCKDLNGSRDDLARMLIEKGADLNLKNSEGESALHLIMKRYAQDYEKVEEVVNLMIEKNVDLNIKNNEGETPTFYALCEYDATHNSKEFELLKTLLNKCDLYAMDDKDKCILDYIHKTQNSKEGYRAGTVVKERIQNINRQKSDELEKQIEFNLKDCTSRKLRSIHYNAERRNDVLLVKKIEERQSKFERMLNYLHILEFGIRI